MHFPPLTIGKPDDPKGRTFTVHYVASMEAPQLCPPAGNGTLRPILLAYAGTPSTVRAFTMNLRCGLAAAAPDRKFELLRSAGYRYQLSAPTPSRALAIAYLPDLFHLQPGVQDHDVLRFVSAPPRWWLDQQQSRLAPLYGSLAREYARAMAFVARLDARTPLPIANDPEFHHALYQEALAEPWTAKANGEDFTCHGLKALGLDRPVLCDIAQSRFADFLAVATAKLLPRQVSAARLTAPPLPSTQLTLSFLTA